MSVRESKGIELAKSSLIDETKEGWIVSSQSDNRRYFIKKDFSCNCLDHQTRNVKCKHAYAVEFFLQKPVSRMQSIVQPIREPRKTYSQIWPAYNKSQTSEKELFLQLLADLTKSESDKHFGRPSANIGEMAFCCVLKVYTHFSTRRANTEIKDAAQKGLISVPYHYNTIIKYFDEPELTKLLQELIFLSASPLTTVEKKFAIDSSGFRTTQFNEYAKEKHGTKKEHQWVKVHVLSGTKTNIICAVDIGEENSGDSPRLIPLAQQTLDNGFNMEELSGDKAYSSRDNLSFLNDNGVMPFIPFRKNMTENAKGGGYIWKKMFHYFHYNQEQFLQHYHARSNAETTFYMIKSKFNDTIRSKKKTAQTNEMLCKILCHNIVVLIHEMHELGIKPDFCTQSPFDAHKGDFKG